MRAILGTFVAALLLTGCGGDGMGSTASAPEGGSSGSGSTTTGGVAASSSPPAVSQALSANTSVDPSIVAADNGFGVTLFQRLLPQTLMQNPNGNIAISPISVAMALQVVYNGASGGGAQGMAQALQLGSLSAAQLNADNAALQASFISSDPQVQVTVANSLWVHLDSSAVAPSFIQMDQTYYGAQVGDLSAAPGNINTWVSQQTQGLITQIMPTGLDYAQLVAVVANAIYFKGAWTNAFDSSQTTDAAFTRDDGTQPMVPFMHQTEAVPYLQGPNYQAISLAYGEGHYSMLIVLPEIGVDMSGFVASLSGQSFATMAASMQGGTGTLSVPKFSTGYAQNLSSTLGSMGMTPVLCPSQALTAIGDGCISFVQHATMVEADETGTVAAAATAVGVGIQAVTSPPPPFTMTMDHPFLYAIVNTDSGELLFVGAMMDPSAAASL
jgi:serine protease inhibitor